MKLINNSIHLSESEAILFTVGMELSSGSEFDTQAWIKRGCLKSNDGTHKKLIDNLDLCSDSVTITGKGKKRTYILNNPHSLPKEKIEKRKYHPSSEDLKIDDYVFSYLLNHKEFSSGLPYKSWANELQFFDTVKLNDSEIRKAMAESLDALHAGKTFKYSDTERIRAINEFIYLIKNSGETVVENAFNRLQRDDKIIVSIEYYAKKTNNKYEQLSETAYRKLIQEEDIILEKHQLSRRDYVYRKRKMNLRNEEFQKVFDEIGELMKDKYGIKYYFKAFLPIVINRKQILNIDREDGVAAHYNRIFKLAEKRQYKNRANNEEDFLKKWHFLNLATLFEVFDIRPSPKTLVDEKAILTKDQKRSFNSVQTIKKEVVDNLPTDF